MSGFASGVQAGLAMSNQWMDTYERAKRRGLMAKATNEKEFEKYSQESANRLRELSEAKDEFGNQKYQLEIDPGSTQYRYREIKYEPMSRAAPPPGDIDYDAWERQYGLAKQDPTAVAEAVPPIGMEERVLRDNGSRGVGYGVYNTSAPGLRTDDLRNLGLARTAPPMQGEVAGAQYMDLPTSAGEYTPTLDPRQRPEDTDAYRRLATRTLGEPQGLAGPDKVSYFGREYDRDKFTQDERQAAKMDAYARVYEQLGDPEQAMQMRSAAMQMRTGKLQLEGLERTSRQARDVEAVDQEVSTWVKETYKGKNVTTDDLQTIAQRRVDGLLNRGLYDAARAEQQNVMKVALDNLNYNEAKIRASARGAAASARAGDVGAIKEFYKLFPDGADLVDIKQNKDGSVTMVRRAKDGTDLPDYTLPSMDALAAGVEEMYNPGAAAKFVQDSITNNFMQKRIDIESRRATSDEKRAVAYERRANAAENRDASRDVVYLTDGKGVYEYKRGSLQYDKSGRLQLPDGMSLYKGQGQLGQGSLTKEQETALKAVEGSEAFKSAYDIVNDPNAPVAERRAAAASIEQMLRQRGLPTDLYKFEQYEHQPMP